MKFSEEEIELATRVAFEESGINGKPGPFTEDIVGDLLLWLCENYHTVERYRAEARHPLKAIETSLRHYSYKVRQQYKNGALNRSAIHDGTWSSKELRDALKALAGKEAEEYDETLRDVARAFQGLTRGQQDILRLSFAEGLSIAQVAKITGRTHAGIKTARTQNLNKLKQKLNGVRDVSSNPRSDSLILSDFLFG